MTTFFHLLAIGFSALLLSLALTPLARECMRKLGAVDQPSARRINRTPIPRGGGISVVLTVLILAPLSITRFPNLSSAFWDLFIPFAISAIILAGVGFIDDLRGVHPLTKVAAQIIIALLFCYSGVRFILPSSIFGTIGTSPWIYTPLTIIWYIAIINAFNLIDGLDGLASGLAIIAFIGLSGTSYLINGSTFILFPCVIFIGALLGFLRYNYNPASVFLGDTGSLFLGLSLATFALHTSQQPTLLISLGVPLLCIGIPLADTCLAILRRTLRRILHHRIDTEHPSSDETQSDAIMTADRDHLHHRMLHIAKGDQRRAVWLLYTLAIGLVCLGIITILFRNCQISVFLAGFVAFAYVITRAMTNIELWDTGKLLSNPEARIGTRRSFVIPLYLLADLISMLGLYLLFAILMGYTESNTFTLINHFILFAVPVFIALVLTKCYIRIWGRSTRKDSFTLIFAVFIGSLIAHLIKSLLFREHTIDTLLFHLVWTLVLPLPLLGIRLCKSALLQLIAERENDQLKAASLLAPSIPRILFYGAGWNLRAYITLFETNVTTNTAALIGVLDDNPSLRGRIFRQLPVLGPLEILDENTLNHLRPTEIIITSPRIKDERYTEILDFCKAHAITVKRFSIEETTL